MRLCWCALVAGEPTGDGPAAPYWYAPGAAGEMIGGGGIDGDDACEMSSFGGAAGDDAWSTDGSYCHGEAHKYHNGLVTVTMLSHESQPRQVDRKRTWNGLLFMAGEWGMRAAASGAGRGLVEEQAIACGASASGRRARSFSV